MEQIANPCQGAWQLRTAMSRSLPLRRWPIVRGSFNGRAFPPWANAAATEPNICPAILTWLSEIYGRATSAEDVIAYLAAVAANPAYTARFAPDLVQPGLRIPLTGDPTLFDEAVQLGREVILAAHLW